MDIKRRFNIYIYKYCIDARDHLRSRVSFGLIPLAAGVGSQDRLWAVARAFATLLASMSPARHLLHHWPRRAGRAGVTTYCAVASSATMHKLAFIESFQ